MSMKKLLFVILFFYCTFSYAQTFPSDKKNAFVFPNNTWEFVKDPSAQGWDTAKLNKLKQFIIDSANTTGMMVVQYGKVIFSYGDIQELSYIASCRKSVLSILYGPFVENGKINLNKTLEQLNIDDDGGLMPIEKKATIQNLLTARSGIYHAANYSGDEFAIAPKRGTVLPGSFFLYNNWDFNLAGYLFEKLTGIGIYDAVDSMLARPLKMEDWNRKIQHKDADTSKSKYPAYPLWFSTRDMARIGYLMLRNGQWGDKQIVSTKWVRTITTPVTSFKEANEYKAATIFSFLVSIFFCLDLARAILSATTFSFLISIFFCSRILWVMSAIVAIDFLIPSRSIKTAEVIIQGSSLPLFLMAVTNPSD